MVAPIVSNVQPQMSFILTLAKGTPAEKLALDSLLSKLYVDA